MKKAGYLVAIASGLLGGAIGFWGSACLSGRAIKKSEAKKAKFAGYFDLLDAWMTIKEEGKSIPSYFEKMGYSRIGIYGLGKVGNHFLREMEGSEIQILYVIDEKGKSINPNLPVYIPGNDIPEADVVVVTATFDYENIKGDLEQRTDARVISIDDVVYSLL